MAQQIDLPTQRMKILSEFADRGNRFVWTSRPYKSTYQWTAAVVATSSAAPAEAIFRSSSVNAFEYFSYKIGDAIPWGNTTTRAALEDDTNQGFPRRTNGVENFVIEGISATARSIHGQYAAATYTGTDPDVINQFIGQAVVQDPAALFLPPQWGSPLNLECLPYSAIAPHISVEFVFDRNVFYPIGTLDEIPEGAGKSFLKANGVPETFNRYKIPEGYLWRAVGGESSDFVTKAILREAVAVPITAINLANNTTATTNPTFLFVDIALRVHGLSVFYRSTN